MDLGGVNSIMADVAIEYKNQAFYNDQLIIEMGVQDFERVSFDIFYRISTSEKLIAVAKTGIVTFDYHKNKVVAIPDEVRKKFNQL